MQERGCRGCESWLDSGVAVCDSGNIMRACNSLVPPQVFLDASAAELRQLLNRDFMPDHVPKSSPLPKLLIKRNFNSPIFIYRPPIDPKRFKIARSKMINRKTHSSGIRSSCNDAIHSDSIAFTLRSFFSSPLLLPRRCFKRVVACSTMLCHASSSRCVYLSIQPLSNHRRNIPRI